MRVLVAGATGALGRALVLRLAQDRHVVRAVAVPATEPLGAGLLAGELRELARGWDAVVDVAGSPSTTGRLLDAALVCGVPRYIQRSFAAIYRDAGDRWLDEDAPLVELSERCAGCRAVIEAESLVRLVDPHTVAWTILRGGSFVGAGTPQDRLIDRLRTRNAVVDGDGSNYVSPLNVADMASAVAAALRHAPAGSTFNVIDEPLRYSDYVDALADLIGVARPPRAAARPLRASRRCTNHAARTVLRWMPRHTIWPSRRAAAS